LRCDHHDDLDGADLARSVEQTYGKQAANTSTVEEGAEPLS
jgi:hypothetical protein